MDIRERNNNKKSSSYKLFCFSKCFQVSEMEAKNKQQLLRQMENNSGGSEMHQKQPGGWRAMPFILGNETFERLATFGLLSSFMVYLMKVFNMEQANAANLINMWMGISNFAPLIGAFISDAYVGRFKTIAFASCAAFLGMMIVTLTAWLPDLHPPKCTLEKQPSTHCEKPTTMQLGVLLMGLGFLSIGTGGIRPCSIPFGVDQFDPTTEQGIKGTNSFYNWYYATFTVVILITLTLVVYIQDSVSWVIGFGIPTTLMFCSIVLFFVGMKIYVHVKPEGSIFTGIAQVFVVAYKKRNLKFNHDNGDHVKDLVFYDPPQETLLSKLPKTDQFRFLNKAAIVEKGDLNPEDSSVNKWRLCTIQQIEEVKCVLKIIPLWASGIVSFTAMSQQGTFTVSQALKMDRHLSHSFQIPAASIVVISMITIGLWLPFYDRVIVPSLRRITKHEGGITLLQRMGIGIVFSVLSMVVAGITEKERRNVAVLHPKATPMSVLWLSPQLVLMGFCEAFNAIGQLEFFNGEFPDHMKSIGNSLFFVSFAGSSYLSSLVITVVHSVTKTHDHPDWLTNDLNKGRLDYFYYLLAVMGVFNFGYFLYCASKFQYKQKSPVAQIGDKSYNDVELSSRKIPGEIM